MDLLTGIRDFISDFIIAIRNYWGVPAFFRQHRLWRGFYEHKLVALALIAVGILFGLHLMGTVREWWREYHGGDILEVGAQAAGLVGDVMSSSYTFLFVGAYKYVVLIIMELLIFHIALRTGEIVKGKTEKLTTGLFVHAQIRMIKVSVFTYIMEVIVSLVLSIILSQLGLRFLKVVVLFLVQCFFLGFALIDNHNEINHMSIRDSFANTRQFPGAATAIGLVMYVLMLIPFLGPFLGPMSGAVAATITMTELEEEQALEG